MSYLGFDAIKGIFELNVKIRNANESTVIIKGQYQTIKLAKSAYENLKNTIHEMDQKVEISADIRNLFDVERTFKYIDAKEGVGEQKKEEIKEKIIEFNELMMQT